MGKRGRPRKDHSVDDNKMVTTEADAPEHTTDEKELQTTEKPAAIVNAVDIPHCYRCRVRMRHMDGRTYDTHRMTRYYCPQCQHKKDVFKPQKKIFI